MRIPPVGTKLFHADRRTWRRSAPKNTHSALHCN